MSSSPKVLVLAAILVLVAVITGIAGLVRLRMLPRFPYMTRPLVAADYAALAAAPGWQAREIEVAPGVRLRGLVREPAVPRGPWVLFFNGNSGRMLAEGQQVLDALCAGRGWGGVVWAYRGFDSSDGTPDPASLTADAFAVYSDLLATRHLSPSDVHIVGFSLGTGLAAAVAAQAHDHPPASLTLLAPMTHLYLGERTQPWLDRYETLRWLDRIASPTLVIHGSADTTLAVANGREVAAGLGSHAQFLEVPGLGHYELPGSSAAQEALSDFILRTSAGPGGTAP